MPELVIEAPLRGLSDDRSFIEQPPSTTREAVNVRAIDKLTGRTRLSSRAGLSKFQSTQLNASAKVSWLDQVTYNNLKVAYSLAPSATEVWSEETPEQGGAYSVQVSARGDVYVLARPGSADGAVFWRYNADGHIISTTTIPLGDSGGECWTFFVDELDDVWVGVGIGTALTSGRKLLFRFQLQDDGTHKLIYTMKYGSASNSVEFIRAIYVKDNILYTLQSDNNVATPTAWIRSYRDIRQVYRPEEVDINVNFNAGGTTGVPYDLVVNDAGEIIVGLVDLIGAPESWLVKYNAQGVLIGSWTRRGTVDGGGIGCTVGLASDGSVYTTGPAFGVDQNFLRKWTDNGTTNASAWIVDDANNTETLPFQKLRVDEFDNVILAFPRSVSGLWSEVRIYDTAGSLVMGVEVTGAPSNVAIPPTNPEYDPLASPEVPEFIYYVGQTLPVVKLRVADVEAKTGSTRTTKLVSVCGGEVKLFDSSTVSASIATLSATSEWIMSVVMFGKVYLTDGVDYTVIDPILETSEDFISHTSGSIPPRCLLMASWRGRMVLAGDPDDRHNWHMSAAGNVHDWDQFPPIVTATTAVSGNNAEQVGRVPDLINCLIPYSDDILIFGCDHSIYMLRGDPMAGGTLDLVSDQIGMSFGAPWCRGPDGRIYFFGARGGVYSIHPYNGSIERMTRDTIERRMLSLDLSTYFVRLAWNWADEGLHVLVMPYGAGGDVTTHWFWDSKNDAWWEDEYGAVGSTQSQPTAVLVVDGDDPDDRVMVFGSEDGYALKWDAAAQSDDGVAIDARVLYGPFQGPELTYELKVRDLTAVLSDTQGGVDYEFFVSDQPDVMPVIPSAEGYLTPGRNPRHSVRARGMAVWMRLRTASQGESWAVEVITANYELGARMRVRA